MTERDDELALLREELNALMTENAHLIEREAGAKDLLEDVQFAVLGGLEDDPFNLKQRTHAWLAAGFAFPVDPET